MPYLVKDEIFPREQFGGIPGVSVSTQVTGHAKHTFLILHNDF